LYDGRARKRQDNQPKNIMKGEAKRSEIDASMWKSRRKIQRQDIV